MYGNVFKRLFVGVVSALIGLGVLGRPALAKEAPAGSEWKCSGGKCVLVKSAPATATCRIVDPGTTEVKQGAATAGKTAKASTVSAKTKRSKATKAVAHKKARSTTAKKRTRTVAHR